jgi:adenylate kinase
MRLLRHDEVVLLLGAPGAGKGTQARFLVDLLGAPHVASGELLRAHREQGSPLGQQAKAYMDRGDLVPDALVIDMIMDRLAQPDAAHGALLDGFPRTCAQAEALEQRLAERDGGVRAAVYVDVPTDVLVDRLAGRWLCRVCQASYHEVFNPPTVAGRCHLDGGVLYQRPDDRREVVSNRVAVYLRDTLPVIERYEQRGLLRRIDGNQPIESVRAALAAAFQATEAVPA